MTSETHEPQLVPALVQLLTPPTALSFCSRMAPQICPLLTLLQEQICAASGSASTPKPAGSLAAAARGGSGSPAPAAATTWFCASCKSCAVGTGVADQHAAEQVLACRRQHQLLVERRDCVSKRLMTCAPCVVAERVAEARDVDAQQLELGAHVEARERAALRLAGVGRAPRRPRAPCGSRARPGRSSAPRTRRTRRWRRSPGRSVRQRSSTTMPPRSPTGSPAARASSSRGRIPAEKTRRSRSAARRRRRSAAPGPRPSSSSRARISLVDVAVWTSTPSSSMRRRRTAPPISSTCSAMRRGANSITCVFEPQLAERVRRLEAEQPAADDGADAPPRAPPPVADRLQVVDRAVDEAAGRVASRDRRHERVRPGRQDQPIVRDLPLADEDHAPRAVEPRGAGIEPDGDPGRLVLPRRRQRHLLGVRPSKKVESPTRS